MWSLAFRKVKTIALDDRQKLQGDQSIVSGTKVVPITGGLPGTSGLLPQSSQTQYHILVPQECMIRMV